MYTDTDICNQALDLLGKDEIASLADEDSRRAATCRRHYEVAVRSILTHGKFSFANKLSALALTSADVPFDFIYQHRLPNDPPYLTLVEIEKYDECPFDYEIFGNYFLSDKATINIKYTGRVAEADFTATFVELLVYKLASKMALRLTGQASIKALLHDDYRKAYQKALVADAMARSPKKIYRKPGRLAFLR